MKEPIRVKDFENQIANLIEENMKLNNLLSSQFSSIAANVGSQRYHSHNPPPFLQMPYKWDTLSPSHPFLHLQS